MTLSCIHHRALTLSFCLVAVALPGCGDEACAGDWVGRWSGSSGGTSTWTDDFGADCSWSEEGPPGSTSPNGCTSTGTYSMTPTSATEGVMNLVVDSLEPSDSENCPSVGEHSCTYILYLTVDPHIMARTCNAQGATNLTRVP